MGVRCTGLDGASGSRAFGLWIVRTQRHSMVIQTCSGVLAPGTNLSGFGQCQGLRRALLHNVQIFITLAKSETFFEFYDPLYTLIFHFMVHVHSICSRS